MSYLPRQEILTVLEWQGARLRSPETISDDDLREIWGVIEGLMTEIDALEEACDGLGAVIAHEAEDDHAD